MCSSESGNSSSTRPRAGLEVAPGKPAEAALRARAGWALLPTHSSVPVKAGPGRWAGGAAPFPQTDGSGPRQSAPARLRRS